jgi:predicted transcriptional regulator
MARKPSPTLTDAELRIMRVLWARGESTNVEILAALADHGLARNTVMTTLGVLERKNCVRHRTDGRTFVYHAVVDEDAAQGTALESVISRFFEGSAEQLVVKLMNSERISDADRKRIQRLVDEAVDG